jgi:hypothetical protein
MIRMQLISQDKRRNPMPVDKKTFDAVRQRVIETAPDGLSKVQFDNLLDAELAKIDLDSKLVTPPKTPERSWGDVALSAKDTVAEFAPAALATALSGEPGGRYLGYAGGQGIREVLQRGGQIPGAIADIYRNLRDGDPNVRFATLKGAAQGAAQGASNLIPGSRSTQEAIASLQADKPYTATAQGIDAALDIATVGGAKAIRKVFTNRPERAILGTLLGLGGATVGEKAADVGADVAGLTPDQRELARKLVSIPAAAATASFAHPKVSGHPLTAGVAVGGTSLALGASPLAAFNAGSGAFAAAGAKPYIQEWLRTRSEGLKMKAAKKAAEPARLAAKEAEAARLLQESRDYTAKLLAEKNARNDKLLAEERALTEKTISAKQQGALFKLDQAHKNRLERDVLQAGTDAEQAAVRRSQKAGDLLESREFAANLAAEKAAEKVLEAQLQDALRASREGKTELIRKENFTRANAIRATQQNLTLERETRTRSNVLSDAAVRNARKAEITAAHTAAQLKQTHLSNVESMLKAQTPDALNAARQMADYHLELADSLDLDVRAALQGKIDQIFETQSATMAERLAEQNAQMQGLEPSGIRATRSSSTQDASGKRQRVTEAFREPAPADELVPQQDLPASSPMAKPKGSTPTPKTSDKVTPDNVLEKLKEQADELARRSMPSTLTPNEIRDQLKNRPSLELIVIAQELADKPIHTPETDNLRSEYSALYKGLTGAAPTTSNQFSPSHVQGKWFASGMNEADKSLLSAATKSPRGRITVTGLDVGN